MNATGLEIPEPERPSRITALMEASVVLSLAAAVLSLFLLGWIANEMREGDTIKFDFAVRNWVHRFASPGMTRAMTGISLLGYDLLIVALVVALATFLYLRWRRAAVWLAVSMAGALALDLSLKYAFHRPRPQPFFGAAPHSFSFPSGHALCSFCFYVVLAGLIAARTRSTFLRVAVGVMAAALVIAIGLSRIYLGMHYPSDVLAGYLAAAVWVATLLVLDRWRLNRRKLADRRR
ncbi:MAG TPA: phosphatase PAP2 family protein [Candidatus Angelobacter sp.]|nr:phosphatase PAP2 family protein [Candidatus Angelobacter sp.]